MAVNGAWENGQAGEILVQTENEITGIVKVGDEISRAASDNVFSSGIATRLPEFEWNAKIFEEAEGGVSDEGVPRVFLILVEKELARMESSQMLRQDNEIAM